MLGQRVTRFRAWQSRTRQFWGNKKNLFFFKQFWVHSQFLRHYWHKKQTNSIRRTLSPGFLFPGRNLTGWACTIWKNSHLVIIIWPNFCCENNELDVEHPSLHNIVIFVSAQWWAVMISLTRKYSAMTTNSLQLKLMEKIY